MTLPSLTVEFGFGQSIGTTRGSVTWTDVTDYARAADGLSFSRGRTAVGQPPSAGTLSVSLANSDGRFTPGLTSGPYGTGVVTRIPVRVVANIDTDADGDDLDVTREYSDEYSDEYGGAGATAYDVWYGFVTDIDWNAGSEVRVSVQAADILAQAAKIRCKPWLTGRHLAQEPTFYWPLSDPAEATAAASGLPDGKPLGVVDESSSTPDVGVYSPGIESDLDESPVAAFTPKVYSVPDPDVGAKRLTSTVTGASGVTAFSVWFRASTNPAPGGTNGVVLSLLPTSAATWNEKSLWIAVDGGLITIYDGSSPSNDSAQYGSSTSYKPGRWAHVLVLRTDAGSTWPTRCRVWLNGVELSTATTTFSGAVPFTTGTQASLSVGTAALYSGLLGFDGQIAHPAMFDNPADPAALAAYLADNGDDAPSAADRFADLDDVTPIPGAIASWLAADATALQPVSPQPTAARTLLEVAQDVATTERGTLIAGRDGRLRLQSARARLTETVALTLDARTDVLTFDGAFGVDDADAVDEVTVTQKPSGATFTGRRTGGDSLESTGFDVWTPSATHAQSVADGAANYPADTPKAPNMTVSMERMGVAGLAGDVLALELGDLIRVTNLPSSAPNTTVDLVVEAISHAVDAGGWTVTFDTSPGPLAAGAVVGTTGALSTVATTLMVRN